MSSGAKFLVQTQSILSDYADEELTYAQAEIMIDEATQSLLMEHLEDTPDDVLEMAFHAHAALQLEAFRQEDVTENEAVAIIEQRAQDYFDKSRSPEEIEKLWRPYDQKVEDIASGNDTGRPIKGQQDADGFWEGFSLN